MEMIGKFKPLPLNTLLHIEAIVTIHYFKYSKEFVFGGEKHDFWELTISMIFIMTACGSNDTTTQTPPDTTGGAQTPPPLMSVVMPLLKTLCAVKSCRCFSFFITIATPSIKDSPDNFACREPHE